MIYFLIFKVWFLIFSSSFFWYWLFCFSILWLILFINFSLFSTFLIHLNILFLFFLWIKVNYVRQNILFLFRFRNCFFCRDFFFFLKINDFSFVSPFCFWLNSIVTFGVHVVSIKENIFKFIKYLLKMFQFLVIRFQ